MLIFRILGTIFVGLSCITCFIKNVSIMAEMNHPYRDVIIFTNYGWLWRTLVIVALWIIWNFIYI